ncbi:MAG: FHA domain-containing protein [Candidatus Acididesulfobacter guangdongensis]|uniref:FHA domain-containing protein n=1 Tax=Acididesulfobacter guangdongensis TaxID=2597225 RepID=A0A519BFA9_ACIG2|nr:MAG: FHA domain-containing protein [Candidatus Acididesulfobacter guangdongensis]
MKTCPSCGKKFTDDKKFCNLDGTELIVLEIPEEAAIPEQTASEEHLEDPYANDAVNITGDKISDGVINNSGTGNKINKNNNTDNDNIDNQGAVNKDRDGDIFSDILSKDTFFADKNAATTNEFKYARITLKHDNNLTEQFFDLNSESMIIGRFDQSTGNVDIDLSKLPDAEHISRKHARFTFENGKWFIEDLKSTNGVFVKVGNASEFSSRITEPTELRNRDQISIGDIIFLFTV